MCNQVHKNKNCQTENDPGLNPQTWVNEFCILSARRGYAQNKKHNFLTAIKTLYLTSYDKKIKIKKKT